ncbi:MAG: hypothetical protein ABIO70_09915 [Pseudomonadota bacterium]
MLALLFTLACTSPDTGSLRDSAGPVAAPLERFHPLVETVIQGVEQPSAMGFLEASAVTFVLDHAAGRVHLLDPHFHHSRATHCLGTRDWPGIEVGEARQGGCREGEVELHRGWVEPSAPPVAVAADEEERAIWLVDARGGLSQVPADPLQENPFDHLRLQEPLTLALEASDLPLPEGHLAVAGGALLLAAGEHLYRFDRDGALLDERALPDEATAVVLVEGAPWVAAGEQLWRDGAAVTVEGSIAALVPDGEGGVWAAVPTTERLLRFLPGGEEPIEAVELAGLTGALAHDPGAGRLYAATTEGIAAFDTEAGSLAGTPEVAGAPADLLVVTESHEILALRGDTLAVASDEGAMEGPPPIALFVVVSLEKPKAAEEPYPCTAGDGEESIATWAARALANLPFVASLPPACAVGVIPGLLERVQECGRLADMAPWWEETCEAGPLFHTAHEDCGADQDCHLEALRAEADAFTARIPAPRWISGLAALADDGAEWPAHVQALGLGDLPLLHFGMDLDPDIPHADPRAKEPYPPEPARMSTAWRASSLDTLAPPGDPDGFLAIYPGDDWPGFTHGGCPNLFLTECSRLSLGGGSWFSPEAIQGLDVLAHRAIARRATDGPASWGFYLPDPGQFDYTAGCTEQDGVWSGEDCQAATLQAWLLGLDARFVGNGLAAWRKPSELAHQ